jgi:AraC-like DNA-binding protein
MLKYRCNTLLFALLEKRLLYEAMHLSKTYSKLTIKEIAYELGMEHYNSKNFRMHIGMTPGNIEINNYEKNDYIYIIDCSIRIVGRLGSEARPF